METIITTDLLERLAMLKLLFYVFIAAGIFCNWRWRKPVLLVLLASIFFSTSYAVAVHGAPRTWWGLQGDEVLVTSFLERAASGQFGSDFFYRDLPSFYPPLYFWILGAVGWLFKLNGVQLAKLGALAVITITPLLVYWLLRFRVKLEQGSAALAATSALAIFVVADWGAVILKPFEFLSAVLLPLWAFSLMHSLETQNYKLKTTLWLGLLGGLLFMTFYFWFLPLAIGLAFLLSISKNKIQFLVRIAATAGVAIVVALPYWLPLVISIVYNGYENWQPYFFIPQNLDLYLPFLQFTPFGLVALAGVVTLAVKWKELYVRTLGAILIGTYGWYFLGVLFITLGLRPMMPEKGFLLLGGSLLSLLAAYGGWSLLRKNPAVFRNQLIVVSLSLVVLATQLLGGTYYQDAQALEQLSVMHSELPPEVPALAERIQQVPGWQKMTLLTSGTPQLSAFLPVNQYLSYNINYSHPAANFSERYQYVQRLAGATDAATLVKMLQAAPHGPIDGLLLYRENDTYSLFFWLDNYPNGGKVERLEISASLFDPLYFDTVFRYYTFSLFIPRDNG